MDELAKYVCYFLLSPVTVALMWLLSAMVSWLGEAVTEEALDLCSCTLK